MMIRSITLATLLTCAALPLSVFSAPLTPAPEHSFSAVLVAKFITQFHYKKNKLDDAQSKAILDEYIDSLDPNRNIFTSKDIEKFNLYNVTLDDAIRDGNLTPAFSIYRKFNQRRIERANFALERLTQPFDFTIDEEYLFDRREAAWPEDKKALNEIWRKRVKNDIITLSLSKKSDEEIQKTLHKRYERIKTRTKQIKPEDVYEAFINAYLVSIEPHTAYFSPRTSENFNINMRLSLEGIGAVLQTVGDYTVVKKTIPGGPAEMSGQFHSEDRISSVGQGHDGEMEDVVGWRIDDVVALIRGPKNTVVRLQLLPKGSEDSPGKIVTITRDKIKLEEQHAKKSIIEIPNGDSTSRIGVITIPTFYMDFDGARRGDKDYVSTTRDTRKLLKELEAEQIDGLVIDLADNGGGSLPEAISLTGLFIESGPVVQVRDSENKLDINEDTDDGIAYKGPVAVLVNRYSASASEIFAGAMQDYGRATIVGETTYGKGTVQQVLDLNRHAPRNSPTLGQLKLTMAQFYRINGDSTQNRGVIPDIKFPTAESSAELGESALDNALPWARIEAAKYKPYGMIRDDLTLIQARHLARTETDKGFQYLQAQAEARKEALAKKSVSLLKATRKDEREKQRLESLARLNNFRVSIGLPANEMSDLENDSEVASAEDEKFLDEVRNVRVKEAAAILADLIGQPDSSVKLTSSTQDKTHQN
jgi:carboxyl-terminal processing protease